MLQTIRTTGLIFFDDMSDWIISDSSIIGGDLNCNIDNVKIKDGSKTILKNVINEKDLCDVWRTIHPDKAGYTHYHKASKQATRIDYLFLSSNLLSNVLDVRVNPHGNSDHSIVCMKLHDPGNVHGQGRWICNNSLLNDNDCKYRIETFLQFWTSQKYNYKSLLDWWESGKFRIKEILQDYGKEKAHLQKQRINDLKKTYNRLLENPDSSADAIKDIEAQIKAYEIEEWSKAKIRVRNTIKEEGEKASKFFLNLEKQQVQNSKIDRLVNAEGKFIDQPHSMLDHANDFYSDLYKEEDISDDHLNDIISKISR